jgi:hypothetical protein
MLELYNMTNPNDSSAATQKTRTVTAHFTLIRLTTAEVSSRDSGCTSLFSAPAAAGWIEGAHCHHHCPAPGAGAG